MDLHNAKIALRREIRSKLNELAPAEKASLDASLTEQVMQHPWVKSADTLLCYVSLPFEPYTGRIIEAAWNQSKQTAFPVCTAPGEMRFILADSWDVMHPGAYNIPEPAGTNEPEITAQTVCLVPAFAFTPDGRRLGKGGGYYDRFLAVHPNLRTLGLTYAFLLQEDIPCESHDIGVNAVITDRKSSFGGNHGKSGANES